MASAGIVGELNAQLEKRSKTTSSDPAVISVEENHTEVKNDETSEGASKKKSKGGIFGKFKRLVKKPGQKKQNADKGSKENGQIQDKRRTKSTSDLTESGEENKASSPRHGSKQKHGISLFFERKIKGRSSLKSKAKKDESGSEPVSPESKARAYTSPVRTMERKEREELETINKKIADDSFFQVSLTSQGPETSVLSGMSTTLDDFGIVSEASPGIGQQNVAQDRIRLAPKGRRKPTRFNSKTDTSENNAAKKEKTEETSKADKPGQKESVEKPKTIEKPKTAERLDKAVITEKLEKTKKPEVPQKPQKSVKGSSSQKAEGVTKTNGVQIEVKSNENEGSLPKVLVEEQTTGNQTEKLPALDLSLGDDTQTLDLSDTVIIKTPTEPRTKEDVKKTSTPVNQDFGSWEHLFGARSDKSSNKSDSSEVLATSEEKPVKEESKTRTVKSFDRKEELKAVDERKASEENKGQLILDLIEGKTEVSKDVDENVKSGKNKSPKNSVVVAKTEGDGKVACGNEQEMSTAFDALISRTQRVNEEQQTKDMNSKQELKDNAKSNELVKTTKLNWSFDLQESDDMRSNDVQPMTFKRSHSMSTSSKDRNVDSRAEDSKPELIKWKSMDDSMTQEERDKKDEAQHPAKNGELPQWVSIAREKHMRHTSMDEEDEDDGTLEETMEEIKDIAAQIGQPRNIASPPTKDKPATATSKIPKPAFKSQSMKISSSSTVSATKLQPRNSVTSKVSSPVSSCIVCSKPAYQFERCDVDGKVIHKNCARCSMCSRTMNVGTIRVVNEKLYCGIHARTAAS